MADNANPTTQLAVEHRSETARLARERLLWAVRPFGFIGLVLWVLTPSTSAAGDISSHALQGFLLGAAYGLLVYGEQLKDYLQFRLEGGRDTKNRLPSEFYWGTVEEVKVLWRK
jgi:hypothetical protein